jgi:pyruvate kinase
LKTRFICTIGPKTVDQESLALSTQLWEAVAHDLLVG